MRDELPAGMVYVRGSAGCSESGRVMVCVRLGTWMVEKVRVVEIIAVRALGEGGMVRNMAEAVSAGIVSERRGRCG